MPGLLRRRIPVWSPDRRRRLVPSAVSPASDSDRRTRRGTYPQSLIPPAPSDPFHPKALSVAAGKLPHDLQRDWIWWSLSTPQPRNLAFSDLIEDDPPDVPWHTPEQTAALLRMMSDVNLEKVRAAKSEGRLIVGTVYKRTRRDEAGRRVQRAEARFDGVAGCLRTPVGGSSRQLVVVVKGRKVRTRLISSRETHVSWVFPTSMCCQPTTTTPTTSQATALQSQSSASLLTRC